MSRSLRLEGIAAAPGIAVATARAIDRKKILVPKLELERGHAEDEQARLDLAVADARAQIQLSIDSITKEGGSKQYRNHSMILQTHLLLLGDILLIDATKDLIATKQINAEWALSIVTEDIMSQLSSADNEYLAERAEDIGFVSTRVMRNLLGHSEELLNSELNSDSECIIVTIDLSPAETAQMVSSPILGFATEKGTQTSHTAIMAQALGLPAVVGVSGLTEKVNPGDTLIVDGLDGIIIVEPDDETLARYKERAAQWSAMENRLRSTKDEPSVTSDGVEIVLKGNVEFPGEAPFALDYGAQGIGLYRTEFLYLDREEPPTREEQVKTYVSMLKAVSPRPIYFRTFDIGADKMPRCLHMTKARNPALGMRAIRIGLRKNRDLLKDQIKSIIVAAKEAKVSSADIMFPLISGVKEVRQLKAMVAECIEELKQEFDGFEPPVVKIGAMVELPAAVLLSDIIAREADFLSIGTNDLIQYMMAIDRVNDDVAYLYSPFHPSALRALKIIVDAANSAQIPVSICGGAAGEPLMTPLLVGLGLREMSMAPHSIPFIKAAVRTISVAESEKLVQEALEKSTEDEIEQLSVQFMQGKMDITI
ncbi:MAG: phosphoenolpyruvate--protein phosphotransferase [Deltaproteobacteria bacterium]|nr:phosphoenolpyruvate--protein phosphotransferase [Deltaproteobacteria bacterium]MBN2671162.1 phosphoenolpyruvate--protein phosphotransferase [Deltaproteobacteria bacterium]